MTDSVEAKILEIIREISEIDEVDMEMDFMDEIGLSSLEAAQLIGEVEEAFHIRIPALALRKVLTPADLADAVRERI